MVGRDYDIFCSGMQRCSSRYTMVAIDWQLSKSAAALAGRRVLGRCTCNLNVIANSPILKNDHKKLITV